MGGVVTYVLVCRACDPLSPIPFATPEERGRWAAEHTAGTGHEAWTVWEDVLYAIGGDR